jgi:hypothetical protein
MGVHPLTLDTGYGIIGLAHRPQDIELALTIVTIIFVDRHSYHLLQRFFNYILPLFAHLVKVGGQRTGILTLALGHFFLQGFAYQPVAEITSLIGLVGSVKPITQLSQGEYQHQQGKDHGD